MCILTNCLMTTHVALLFLYFLHYRLSVFISVLVCTIKYVFDGCCPNERSYDATSDLRSMRVQQSRYQRGGYHHGNRYWLCRGPNGTNNRRRDSPVFFSCYFPFFFVILFRTAISRVIQSATKPTDQIADAMRRIKTHVSAYTFLFFLKRNIL